MKENKLAELSMDFSVDIINLVKFLKSNQIGRSGTGIGANIHEAQYAQSKERLSCQVGNCIEIVQRNKLLAEVNARNKPYRYTNLSKRRESVRKCSQIADCVLQNRKGWEQ